MLQAGRLNVIVDNNAAFCTLMTLKARSLKIEVRAYSKPSVFLTEYSCLPDRTHFLFGYLFSYHQSNYNGIDLAKVVRALPNATCVLVTSYPRHEFERAINESIVDRICPKAAYLWQQWVPENLSPEEVRLVEHYEKSLRSIYVDPVS